jgi:hypothetical protein
MAKKTIDPDGHWSYWIVIYNGIIYPIRKYSPGPSDRNDNHKYGDLTCVDYDHPENGKATVRVMPFILADDYDIKLLNEGIDGADGGLVRAALLNSAGHGDMEAIMKLAVRATA